MPHLIVEYSNNLPETVMKVDTLLQTLAETVVATGLFPEKGLRLRAYRADYQRVAEGNPGHGFVHVGMNVGKGRSEEDRQSAGQVIFDALKIHMAEAMASQKILLSFEMREIDPVKFNHRNF